MPREPEITWTVGIEKANMILSIIGKRPFEEVADLIMDLRNQAQQQISQQQGQMPNMPSMPAARANGEAHPDA